MKYTKVILSEKTLGLVFDRISRMMKSGLVLSDGAWNESNLNAFNKSLDFDYQIKHYRNQTDTTLCKKGVEDFYHQTFIRIESTHRGTYGTLVEFGDTIYFGKDEIRIKSRKPDLILNMHSVKRLRLLVRPPYDWNGHAWEAFSKAEVIEEENDRYTDSYNARYVDEYFDRRESEIFEDSFDEDHLLN